MTLSRALHLLRHHRALLLCIPLLLASTVFLLTRNQPKEYTTKTRVYTGFVTGFDIESEGSSRVDYHAANSTFANLIGVIQSRATIQTVAVELLTLHLQGTIPIAPEAHPHVVAAINAHLPRAERLRLKGLGSPEAIRAEVERLATDPATDVYHALFRAKTPYSVPYIERNLKVTRIGSSDFVELTYTSPDAALCQTTLDLLNEVFLTTFKGLRGAEVGTALAYFEEAAATSHAQLRSAVDALRDFGMQNNIINYYEQTKAIAQQHELMDYDLQQTQMRLKAAEAALAELDGQLSDQSAILAASDAVLAQRKRLTDLTTTIALAEAEGRTVDPALRTEADSLEGLLANHIDTLYDLNHSKPGLSRKNLVQSWMDHLVDATEAQADLNILDQHLREYRDLYAWFAPLGSELSSLEREVDIAEHEYLERLHGLNLARLRLHNIELSSTLKVTDPAMRPERPKASKRMILVALSYAVGMVFCLAGILAADLFDPRLRNPEVAAHRTGMPVLGTLPEGRRTDDPLFDTLALQVLNNVALAVDTGSPTEEPPLIMVTSQQPGVGKSHVAYTLAEQYARSGRRTLLIQPNRTLSSDETGDTSSMHYPANVEAHTFEPASSLLHTASISALLDTPARSLSPYDIAVLEAPAMLSHPALLGLLRSTELVLHVARADRGWSGDDTETVRTITAAHGAAPQLVLNRTSRSELQTLAMRLRPRRRLRWPSLLRRSTSIPASLQPQTAPV